MVVRKEKDDKLVSLWIKVYAKWINVNVDVKFAVTPSAIVLETHTTALTSFLKLKAKVNVHYMKIY